MVVADDGRERDADDQGIGGVQAGHRSVWIGDELDESGTVAEHADVGEGVDDAALREEPRRSDR